MEPYWPNREVLLEGQRALAKRAPSKKLLNYLEKYQHDKLTTGTPNGLPDYAKHRDILIELMRQKYDSGQGYHQTLGGRVMNLPKFWELMLSMDFVSHEIKLTSNIGYDESEAAPGLKSNVDSPFAEFTIIDEDLKRAVSGQNKDNHVARVFMDKRLVCLTIDGQTYILKRLQDGGSQFNFMNYLLSPENADIDITIKDVKSIKGCAAVKNITELVRYCGFNEELKKAFFPTCKKDRIRFNQTAILNDSQFKALKNNDINVVSSS